MIPWDAVHAENRRVQMEERAKLLATEAIEYRREIGRAKPATPRDAFRDGAYSNKRAGWDRSVG